MYKNLIKKHLENNLSEATAPAIQLANKIAKDNKKINTKELKDIAKDLTGYEKSSMTKKDEKEIAHNKINYTGDDEKTYHDEMEIMNGQEMITYGREPNKIFSERALEAIEGSARMGNSNEWANVVAAGQGGDPKFGKKLVEKIKASIKKRKDAEKNWYALGDDIEFDPNVKKPFKGRPHAFESTEKKKTINENYDNLIDFTIPEWAMSSLINGDDSGLEDEDISKIDNFVKQVASEYGNANFMLDDVDGKDNLGFCRQNDIDNLGSNCYRLYIKPSTDTQDPMKGFDTDYEKDSRSQQYGINPYDDISENEQFNSNILFDKIISVANDKFDECRDYGIEIEIEKDGTYGIIQLCVEVTNENWSKFEPPTLEYPGYEGGLEEIDFRIIGGVITYDDRGTMSLTPDMVKMISSDSTIDQKINDLLLDKINKEDRDGGHQEFDLYEGKKEPKQNKNKKQIKESMKRLKFKKEFNGFGNAIKLIPESYKVDKKTFEITDGNETYRIRWEGPVNEGKAVILMASDKKLVNEDIQRMKNLFSYKSEETLGLVKGKDRINENESFTDIWKKTKALLEMEDIEGTDGENGDWDDAVDSQAPEAKKHIQGSASTEKGTKAPKPSTGNWDGIKKSAPEASKHIQGSVSSEKGTKAPKPSTGNWDGIKKSAPEATKHVKK